MKHTKARDYRPTMADFTPRNPQQLSCREAGQFDHAQKLKRQAAVAKATTEAQP